MPTTCAQLIVDELSAQGIDTVFGIPGVHTLDLYAALAQTDLRHVTPRHEQSAAFMADGFARASGRPAACILISGPGILNAATAIGQAWSDSVAMLVIATVAARTDLGVGRGRLHEMPDQLAAMRGLMESAAMRVNDPAEALPMLRRLMSRIRLARPRPAYLEVPLDVAAATMAPSPAYKSFRLYRPTCPPKALAAAAEMIRSAHRPVIIAGGGAVDAATPVATLARQLGAPVITTIAGKGTLPETDPLSLGAGLNDAATRAVIERADLVVAVGTELASPDTFLDRLDIAAPLIRIDLDPDILDRDQRPALGLLADAAEALAALCDALAREAPRALWLKDGPRIRAARRQRLREAEPGHCAVLDTLSEALPDDAILVTDMTQIAYTGNGYFQSAHSRCWLHPTGFGTLGYALPAAIGAKLARPHASVVALAGDYGVGFTLPDLATAADLGLALPIVIWNNGGLGQIAKDMTARGMPRLGVDVPPPDFASLSKGYRARHVLADHGAALANALTQALGADGPTLIEVRASVSGPA